MGVSATEISFDLRSSRNHDEKVNQMPSLTVQKLRNQFKVEKVDEIEKRNGPLALLLYTEVERLRQTNPRGMERGMIIQSLPKDTST